MPTLAKSPEAEAVLHEIKPDEISGVDMPANGEPHFVVKGMSDKIKSSNQLDIQKANAPKDSMSKDELVAARDARSSEYGIEVLESGSHLTYPSGFPTNLDDYGDPVNLKYPTETKARAANARARFKQNADVYKKDSSKKVVHERIVRAELKYGSEPVYDSEDPLDRMLSSDLKDQMKEKMEKQGGQLMDKLDTNRIPRPVMRTVEKRMTRILDDIHELQDVVKKLPASEDGAEKAPRFLSDIAKAISADLRSLLPDNEVSVQKRGTAMSVRSLQRITKSVEDVEKANAISYVVRDRWANVSQSISEYVTTYVQGVEHDDNGPILIPDALDSTVEKSADDLDVLVSEYGEPVDEEIPVSEDVHKATSELVVSNDMTVREAFDKIIKAIEASSPSHDVGGIGGRDMSGTEATIKSATSEVQATEIESQQPVETTTDTPTEPTVGDAAVPASKPVEEPATKGTDDPVLAALAAMEKKFDNRFEQFEKQVGEIRGIATSASEKVDKALQSRINSRGGQPEKTTKVSDAGNSKDSVEKAEGSFANILALPKSE